MEKENRIELQHVLHKDLLLVVTPTCFLFIVVDSISRDVLRTWSVELKNGIQDLGLTFDKVSVYVLNEQFTTIPTALFNEKKAKDYLEFTTSLTENSLVFFDKLDLEKLVVAWGVDSLLKKEIVDVFSGAIFKNILTPFIKTTNSYVSKHKVSSLFFEDRVIISVVKNTKIELVNTFEIKSIEDALYYHLLLFQSMELAEEEVKIITGGIYKEMELFIEKLATYFSNINRIVDSSITNNQSVLEIVKSIN